MSNGMKEWVSEQAKVIPEVGYDVISRITPGAVTLVCVMWLTKTEIPIAEVDVLVGVVFIFVAYAVGIVLDSCSNWVGERRAIEKSWEYVMQEYRGGEQVKGIADFLGIPIEDIGGVSIEQKQAVLEGLREHVVARYRYATGLMPKLTGEVALPKNLLAGLVALVVFALYGLCVGLVKRNLAELIGLVPVVIVVGAALVFCEAHRRRRVVVRTLHWFWDLRWAEARREQMTAPGAGEEHGQEVRVS